MKTHFEDTAEEIHGEYRWRPFLGTEIWDGTAAEAADALGLDVEQVEWAIEEYGRCDAELIVAWKPGPIEYGTDEEPIQGGYEWPASEAPAE